jgi:glyoxylate reductase
MPSLGRPIYTRRFTKIAKQCRPTSNNLRRAFPFQGAKSVGPSVHSRRPPWPPELKLSIGELVLRKILITGNAIDEHDLHALVDAGFVVRRCCESLTAEQLAQALSDSSALLHGGEEYISADAIGSAERLRVIAFLGIGYETYIDAAAARARGIVVTITPDTLTTAVAEFSIGMILNATRLIHRYALAFADGKRGTESKLRDLRNLRVGIVGLGAIGTRIAEILVRGFECSVSYYSRTRKPDLEAKLGISFHPLNTLCSEVDVIVIATPGNATTRWLISEDQFCLFRQGAILINPARPDVVDPIALLKALDGSKLGYAAFDGFYDSLEVGRAMLKHMPDRLMVTGHIASLTRDSWSAMAHRAVRSVLNVLSTGTDEFRVL